jgi:Domain of unknown function (DUF4440)
LLTLALAAATLTLPEGPALTEAIRARDAEFFAVYFDRCEPAKVAALITPDLEMYHDKGGVVARTAKAFVADYRKSCTAKLKPDAWRSRRELVAESFKVYPVPGYGAIEEGDHVFYERRGDGPEKRAGIAHFVQLWALTPDGWKLARVLSYAHAPASAETPTK